MDNYRTIFEKTKHTSELSKNVTPERFKKALVEFMNQADKNAVSKKAHGGKKPSGFIDTYFDGADFHTHFGQGAASKAPYLNWWALSIYYIVEDQSIVMGIEKRFVDRYLFLLIRSTEHLLHMMKTISLYCSSQ